MSMHVNYISKQKLYIKKMAKLAPALMGRKGKRRPLEGHLQEPRPTQRGNPESTPIPLPPFASLHSQRSALGQEFTVLSRSVKA